MESGCNALVIKTRAHQNGESSSRNRHVDLWRSVFDEKRNTPGVGREALNRLRGNRRRGRQKANTSLATTGTRSRWQRPENRANT